MFFVNHFWVVGTDTDVGKTIVTVVLLRHLQKRGLQVAPFKPVQTGEIVEDGHHVYYDTAMYEKFSLQQLCMQDTNQYSFKEAASPHYAAQLEDVTIDMQILLETISSLQKKVDVLVVEGAGGVYVPLNKQHTLLDLIEQSGLPVVVVTRTKLGTINHTMLTLEALKNRNIETIGLVFNGYEKSAMEDDNIATILERSFLPYVTIPKCSTVEHILDYSIAHSSLFEKLVNA